MNTKAISFIKECKLPAPLKSVHSVNQELINKPNTPQAKLTRMLSMDPVLTAQINGLANNPLNRGKGDSG